MARGKSWTEAETNTLRELYTTHSINQLANILNRKPMGVINRLHNLHLSKCKVNRLRHADEIIAVITRTITYPNSYTTVHLSGGAY
jgi:hypothetical protein